MINQYFALFCKIASRLHANATYRDTSMYEILYKNIFIFDLMYIYVDVLVACING